MDRIDEIIDMFEKATCPRNYSECPLKVVGNDCDNYCPFTEAADMLKEYKDLKNPFEIDVGIDENGIELYSANEKIGFVKTDEYGV